MSVVFVDRKCPACDGEGCNKCDHTGIVGTYEEIPPAQERLDTVWAKLLRSWRERNKYSMRDMATGCRMSVPRISKIESGWVDPTEEESRFLIKFILESGACREESQA